MENPFSFVVAAGFLPAFVDAFAITNLTYFLVWVFMALGLSLIWGYAGILSFGQTAFFGLALAPIYSEILFSN